MPSRIWPLLAIWRTTDENREIAGLENKMKSIERETSSAHERERFASGSTVLPKMLSELDHLQKAGIWATTEALVQNANGSVVELSRRAASINPRLAGGFKAISESAAGNWQGERWPMPIDIADSFRNGIIKDFGVD